MKKLHVLLDCLHRLKLEGRKKSTAASQLKDTDPELRSQSVSHVLPVFVLVFFAFSGFLPLYKNMDIGGLATVNCL